MNIKITILLPNGNSITQTFLQWEKALEDLRDADDDLDRDFHLENIIARALVPFDPSLNISKNGIVVYNPINVSNN